MYPGSAPEAPAGVAGTDTVGTVLNVIGLTWRNCGPFFPLLEQEERVLATTTARADSNDLIGLKSCSRG